MKTPKFLGYTPKTRKFLQSIFFEYEINDAAGLKLLEVAGACMDRMQEAEELLKREGLVVLDRCGGSKLHPANIILKDARAHFFMGVN